MDKLEATVYTVIDESNILFYPNFKVVEMKLWDWLTLRALMENDIRLGKAADFDERSKLIVDAHVAPGRDNNVWLTGTHVHYVERALKEHEFEVTEEDKEQDEFLREYFYASCNPNNVYVHEEKVHYTFGSVRIPGQEKPLPITFLQLSALNRFASRAQKVEIRGMELGGGGALFIHSAGMLIGIEPDGYTHS